MLMNLKSKVNLIINEDMRYFMIDENYNPNAWENLSNALGNSEPFQVENSSNTELIFHLKSYINEMNNDDLWPLYNAATDNENGLFDEKEIIAMLDGDES